MLVLHRKQELCGVNFPPAQKEETLRFLISWLIWEAERKGDDGLENYHQLNIVESDTIPNDKRYINHNTETW